MDRTRLTALTLSVLLLAGCAQASPAPTENGSSQTAGSLSLPEAPTGPNVQMDWSRLEGNKTALRPDADGGRWYPDYTGDLVPSEDYGSLIPYMGALTYTFNTWTDDSGQEQVWYSPWPTSLYGLMTREGKIVTDPVYLSAEQGVFYWQRKSSSLPILLLSRAKEEWNDFCNGLRYAAAAQDGSWITDFEFWGYTTHEDEVLLYGPGGVTWIDAVSGARQDWSWEFLGVTEEELPSVVEQIMWLYGFQWTEAGIFLGTGTQTRNVQTADQVRVFSPETTEVVWMSRSDWETSLGQWNSQQWPPTGYWEDRREGDQVTFFNGDESYALTVPGLGESFSFEVCEPFAYLCDFSEEQSKCWLFRLSSGELLTECGTISFVTDPARPEYGPYLLVRGHNSGYTFYTPDLEPLYTFPDPSGNTWLSCTLQDGLLAVRDDRTFFGCWDLDAGACIFYRNLDLGD